MTEDGTTRPRIAALVMAAGLSTRMAPANKLLMQDALGSPMVARVAAACSASAVDRIVVVTGHDSAAVRRAVLGAPGGREIAFVHAEDHALGLSASLQAGMAALPGWIDGVLVCLGDMPLVGPLLLDRMVSAFAPAAGRAVVVPVWQGRRGNPVLWGRRFFAELAGLSGDQGARGLIAHHARWVAEVEAPDAGVLTDFDTPEQAQAGLGASA